MLKTNHLLILKKSCTTILKTKHPFHFTDSPARSWKSQGAASLVFNFCTAFGFLRQYVLESALLMSSKGFSPASSIYCCHSTACEVIQLDWNLATP